MIEVLVKGRKRLEREFREREAAARVIFQIGNYFVKRETGARVRDTVFCVYKLLFGKRDRLVEVQDWAGGKGAGVAILDARLMHRTDLEQRQQGEAA